MNAPLVPTFDAEFVPGFFASLPEPVYRRTSALSYSGAKVILRSPAHYRLAIDEPSPPTDAMRFGQAIHLGVLQPARFLAEVLAAPKLDRRTKDGKLAHDCFLAEAAGKLVLSAADFDRARRAIDAVGRHVAARELLRGAHAEGSLFWYDGKYGAKCKMRYDARNLGGLIDLKSTVDASPDAFARQAAALGYHLQAAAYFSGSEHALDATPEFWVWIAVETEPPFGVACYHADAATLRAGLHLWDRALERYKRACSTGTWDGYDPRVNRLPMPKWALAFDLE